MGRIDEQVSAEFAAWEQRGRGWQVWPEPVLPEPPFREFTDYFDSEPPPILDDGRRPGLLASIFDVVERILKPTPPIIPQGKEEPEPELSNEPLDVEFIAVLPATLEVREESLRAFFASLEHSADPLAFELASISGQVALQFGSSNRDAPMLRRLLNAYFPELTFMEDQYAVTNAWYGKDGCAFIVDFGLYHEFMLPLDTVHSIDPFVGLVAALGEVGAQETAVFQVLFQPVRHAWAASAWRSVTGSEGKGLFVNRPHLVPGTKAKLATPLFGVVVRAAAKAESFDRSAAIVTDIAGTLAAFEKMESNRLIPLTNDEYPFAAHEEDLLNRQSRRTGMLLNRDELIGVVHFPSDKVRSPKLRRQSTRTKDAPASVLSRDGVLLGKNSHGGKTVEVRLNPEQRVRHAHIIGASGSGKSTLLFNLIRQDIEANQGVAVLDPHGDLVEKIVGIVPSLRIDDVVFFDPTDEEYSIGFNILSAHSDFEKTLLASDLVSVFRRLSSSWGDQLNSVMNNAILAFLESSRGGTLADLRRFLLDSEFRNEFLRTVCDPDVVYYWRKGFPQLGGNKSIGPVLTRLETFLSPKPIRYMVSQSINRLDFSTILDSGKIFLAKLPQGQIGKENSFLLGSLLVAKFQQMAMSRQRLSQDQRRDFFLYLDECHHFMTASMAEILAGARKYRVGLVLAHQELQQLQRDSEVASAVMSNSGTRIVFRVGDSDAHVLEKGFASFTAKDLQSLSTGEAVCRVERSDRDFNLDVFLPTDVDPAAAAQVRQQVITASRNKYGTPREDVEKMLTATATGTHENVVIEKDSPQIPAAKRPSPPPTTKKVSPASAPSLPTVAHFEPTNVKPPTVLPDLGRGGAQHQAIQRRLKKAAEEVGFRSTIEKAVLEGRGSIDLLLERHDQTIACEISVTTTVDHEVGNVIKCLKAGFSRVVVVSIDEAHREKIRSGLAGSLGNDIAARVTFHHPDDFVAYLQTLSLEQPVAPSEKIRRGFKVIRSSAKVSLTEAKEREETTIRTIAEVMRRKTR